MSAIERQVSWQTMLSHSVAHSQSFCRCCRCEQGSRHAFQSCLSKSWDAANSRAAGSVHTWHPYGHKFPVSKALSEKTQRGIWLESLCLGTPLSCLASASMDKPEVLAGSNLPGHTTPLQGRQHTVRAIPWASLKVSVGFHLCGDSTYPGIGVPSAAMSGHICLALTCRRSVGMTQDSVTHCLRCKQHPSRLRTLETA